MSTDLVVKARDLAYRAHAGQVDKAGRPYIEHVARVAAAVSDDQEAEAVAWLHDVIEDCPDHAAEARWAFPRAVTAAVLILTRGEDQDDHFYYVRVRKNALALRVKLADIADNSNEERLALLDKVTADRLRKKYAKALQALKGHQDEK